MGTFVHIMNELYLPFSSDEAQRDQSRHITKHEIFNMKLELNKMDLLQF